MGEIVEHRAGKPRKLGETVYTDRGSRLAPLKAMKAERWPLYVLLASPVVGLALAAIWQFAL